jgi:uncharacterized protein YbbC (DUF1343 family)
MTARLGLDRMIEEGFARFRGRRIGLVCNQASVSSGFVHVLDVLLPHHAAGELTIQAVFGPQHGIWGHTQDNMIEWEGYRDPRTGLLFHSLYGRHREPSEEMLEGVEHLVIDVPDVGARYYTFIWTTALCLRACERLGIPVTVLDRPNPINGSVEEGPLLEPEYASFVGLHPLRVRHGLTVGEVAMKMKAERHPGVELEVVECEGWDRAAYLDETDFPWAMPSPNMPAVDTAVVYPGMCLLEGTQLSEGRGTTRPFEIFGAPYIDGWRLAEELNRRRLPGALFRPYQFLPTFQKFAGQICQGCFLHVVDRRAFLPFRTGCEIIQAVQMLYPECFAWLQPPYEYEENLMPIDILLGNGWLRPMIESGEPLAEACRGA